VDETTDDQQWQKLTPSPQKKQRTAVGALSGEIKIFLASPDRESARGYMTGPKGGSACDGSIDFTQNPRPLFLPLR
jgi:hypothetical protein